MNRSSPLQPPVPERAFARNELVLHSLSLGAFETNCYLLCRQQEGPRDCLVIDPGLDPEPLLDLLDEEDLVPSGILLTHGHLDHIGGCRALVARTPVPILLHRADHALYGNLAGMAAVFGFSVQPAPPLDGELVEGQRLPFGNGELCVMETPGHTAGSVCLSWNQGGRLSVFCGDLVFEDSYGRTDLPGGNFALLRRSILERLFLLPDDTVLYPGHGNPTTVGRERVHNPIKDCR